jgi:hypothetical protein
MEWVSLMLVLAVVVYESGARPKYGLEGFANDFSSDG